MAHSAASSSAIATELPLPSSRVQSFINVPRAGNHGGRGGFDTFREQFYGAMKLIPKCKPKSTPKQEVLLRDTLECCNQARNFLASTAWKRQKFRRLDLHKLTSGKLYIACVCDSDDPTVMEMNDLRGGSCYGCIDVSNRPNQATYPTISCGHFEPAKSEPSYCCQ
jgi:hypothetical protein